MSKNLTRKGLAFGALVALGSTAIAGSPAFAIDAVSLEPSAGTSYNIILGEDFTLKSIFTDAAQVGSEKLAFEVTDSSAVVDLNAVALNGVDYDADSVLTSDQDPTLDANKKFVVVGSNTQAPASNTLTLLATGSATASVVVKAFLDYDGDATLDTNETVSSTQTVKFVKPSEVTTTTAITAPLENDATVVATLKFNDINNEQLNAAAVGANFTKGDGTVLSATATDVVKFNSTWSTTDFFKFTATPSSNLVKGTAVKVTPLYKAAGLAATDTASTIGSAVTAEVTARTVSALTADSVVSTTQSADEKVALNKAFSVYAKTVDTATPPVALAGKTVSYSVAASALPNTAADVTSSTATLTINGVTYTNEAALPGATGVAKLSGVTNADGKVIVTGSSTGLANLDSIVFSFTTENFTTGLTLIQNTIVPTKAYITNYEGDAAAVASGSSVSVNIAAYDQFGGAMVDGYDARAVWASSTRTTTATTNATAAVVAAVVGGKATLVLPDAGSGTGTNVWSVSLTKRSNTTGTYTGKTSGLGALDFATADTVTAFTVNFKSAADLVAGEITLTDGATALALNTEKTKYVYTAGQEGAVATPGDLSVEGFGTFDARGVVGTVPAPKKVAGGAAAVAVDLEGTVKSASTATYAGVAIPGATVTISGAGLQFQGVQGGANVWAVGSITLNTSSTGAFALNVWSNKAGAQTVTIQSGSAKSVVDLYFDAAAANTGSVLAIDAPATILPGRTLTVKATLVDKFGNPVAVSNAGGSNPTTTLTYSGPGFTTSTITQTLDADGQSTFRVLLGSADDGTATITFTYDADGTATTIAKVTKTATVVVGAAPVVATAAASGSTGKFFASATNAEGKKVVIKVSGKFVTSFTGTAAKKSVAIAALKGNRTVTIYVGGTLVLTKLVTIK